MKLRIFKEALFWGTAAGGIGVLTSLLFGTVIGAIVLGVITGLIMNLLIFLGVAPPYAMLGGFILPFITATCILRVIFFFIVKKEGGRLGTL
ncbi:MAG: hypothetical protein NUV60_00885 [Patescibacteria group bacterium]|nr:hypothetical protein [Patescibacteria group bacterium]